MAERRTTTYQIGRVAQLVHLSLRTLHYWEEVGLISPSARTSAGFRVYSEADVARVRFVRSLKAADLSVDELRELLEVTDLLHADATSDDERQVAADRLRAFVAQIRQRIELLRSRIDDTEQAALELEMLIQGDVAT